MQCECGGWIYAGTIRTEGKDAVGLTCTGSCGLNQPISEPAAPQDQAVDQIECGRVAMGRVW